MFLILDTETMGFKDPYAIQYASVLMDEDGTVWRKTNLRFNLPDGVEIDQGATDAHGWTKDMLSEFPFITESLQTIFDELKNAEILIGHNIDYDIGVLKHEFARNKEKTGLDFDSLETEKRKFCTMKSSTNLVKIQNPSRAGYKWPKLSELHQFLFNEEFENAHDALGDVVATGRCYLELLKRQNG